LINLNDHPREFTPGTGQLDREMIEQTEEDLMNRTTYVNALIRLFHQSPGWSTISREQRLAALPEHQLGWQDVGRASMPIRGRLTEAEMYAAIIDDLVNDDRH